MVLVFEHFQTSLSCHLLVLVQVGRSVQARAFQIIAPLYCLKIITNHVFCDEELHHWHLVYFHLKYTQESRQ